jgi:predicted DNA-binding transcriptional regulator AlpA
MEWMVTAASERLDNEIHWNDLQDALLEVLEDLGTLGVTGWGKIGELGAVFALEANSLAEAATSSAELFHNALKKIGAPPPARIEVEPADDGEVQSEPRLERRVRGSGLSVQAISASEVADLLRVSRQRVYQLLEEREDFPRPVADTSRGAMWDRRDVEHWARKPRHPGRPRKENLKKDAAAGEGEASPSAPPDSELREAPGRRRRRRRRKLPARSSR